MNKRLAADLRTAWLDGYTQEGGPSFEDMADCLITHGWRLLDTPLVDEAWAEQVIARWRPDDQSRAIEARARELAGGNHVHGAIPARFFLAAIAELRGSLDEERLARALTSIGAHSDDFAAAIAKAYREDRG